MSNSDKGGRGGGKIGGVANKAKYRAGVEAVDAAVNGNATLEIGDFVAELATAIRYREADGLGEGDWLEEPERIFVDGKCFGEEVQAATEGKLQISLSLDASYSMWSGHIMKVAAPVFRGLDKMLRQAQAELPPGTLIYSPFLFHETAFKLPLAMVDSIRQDSSEMKGFKWIESGVDAYGHEMMKKVGEVRETYWAPMEYDLRSFFQATDDGETPFTSRQLRAMEAKQVIAAAKTMALFANGTLVAPLFKAISDWEAGTDANATKIDIVITDGVFEIEDDIRQASAVQEGRSGKRQTILLNFTPVEHWGRFPLPDHCLQCAVDRDNLAASVRNVIVEAVGSML